MPHQFYTDYITCDTDRNRNIACHRVFTQQFNLMQHLQTLYKWNEKDGYNIEICLQS